MPLAGLFNRGTNSYAWDAENRLIKITYTGSANNSQIHYDATGMQGQIVETRASAITSTKQFVRSGSKICERSTCRLGRVDRTDMSAGGDEWSEQLAFLHLSWHVSPAPVSLNSHSFD